MNTIRAEMYPWIGIVVSGLVGLLVLIIASNSISYFPYSTEGVDWVGVFAVSAFISLPVAWVVVIVMSIKIGTDEGIVAGILSGVWGFFIGSIGGYIIGGIMGLIIVAIAPIFLGIALGAVTGIVIGIARGDLRTPEDILEDGLSFLIAGGIVGIILSGFAWGYTDEFLINILFIPMAAAVGYIAGKFFERREEERLEYERRIRKRRTKIEQWKRKKYVVSTENELLMDELKFEDYKRRIERLEELEIELDSLDIKEFESEVLLIRQNLKDPNKVEMIESEIASLRKNIKENIENLIYETENIIKKAKNDAINAKNSFWLSALEIFGEDILSFSQDFEFSRFSIKDAMARILNIKEEAEALSIPPDEEIPKEEPTKETYYDILGVSPKASQEEIKKAYRKKTKEYHPDIIFSKWGEKDKAPEWIKKEVDEMSRKLNEVYEVLRDPNRRREYERETGV